MLQSFPASEREAAKGQLAAETPLPIYAGVAQLVEQLIRNQQVAGSSPATSSKSGRFYLPLFRCKLFNKAKILTQNDTEM